MTEIYLHEDDFGQIEILPLSLWQYCAGKMREIDEFSERHKTDFGWNEIYVRDEPPESLSDLSISLSDFKNSAEQTLIPYSKVTTGYSSHVETCENCFAWGIADKSLSIFCAVTKKNEISHITLDFGCFDENTLKAALETFANLPKSNELIIADWRWSRLAKLADEKSLRDYLTEHIC